MTLFDGLIAAADQSIGRVFAESFAFAPMIAEPNADPEADSDRSSVASLTAIFDDQAVRIIPGGREFPERSSSGPEIIVDADQLPEGVKQFDRFTRAKDGQVYEVIDVQPDGLGHYVLRVVELAI